MSKKVRKKLLGSSIIAVIFGGIFCYIMKDSDIVTTIMIFVAAFTTALGFKVAVDLIWED